MRTENDDDGVPVLNEVVESGNESIIQSSRLGREVLRELEMLQQPNPVKFVLQDHLITETSDGDNLPRTESQLDLSLGDSPVNNPDATHSEDEIELMIDELVDRHIHELRKDIRRLLARTKHKT